MTVTLTPEMEALVNEQVATGQFASPEEVIRAALLRMRAQYDELKAAIAEGIEDVRQGRVAPLDTPDILAKVRARQGAEAGVE